MAQLMICSSCKQHYDSVQIEKHKTYYKTFNDCRHVRKQRVRRKSQQASNEDNTSTEVKRTTISIINVKHIRISKNNTNNPQFYNIMIMTI